MNAKKREEALRKRRQAAIEGMFNDYAAKPCFEADDDQHLAKIAEVALYEIGSRARHEPGGYMRAAAHAAIKFMEVINNERTLCCPATRHVLWKDIVAAVLLEEDPQERRTFVKLILDEHSDEDNAERLRALDGWLKELRAPCAHVLDVIDIIRTNYRCRSKSALACLTHFVARHGSKEHLERLFAPL